MHKLQVENVPYILKDYKDLIKDKNSNYKLNHILFWVDVYDSKYCKEYQVSLYAYRNSGENKGNTDGTVVSLPFKNTVSYSEFKNNLDKNVRIDYIVEKVKKYAYDTYLKDNVVSIDYAAVESRLSNLLKEVDEYKKSIAFNRKLLKLKEKC